MAELDLIVVGGGLAGLTGALRAAERGSSKVVVLEQGQSASYPCNTRYSGGIIHCCYRDVMRPAYELENFIENATEGDVDSALSKAIAANGRRLVDWLTLQGARFVRIAGDEAFRWCIAPPRPAVTGIEWRGRGPDVVLASLTQKLRGRGGDVILGATARSLIMKAGRCTGVRYIHQGIERTLKARTVLLADGGFQNNRELFGERIGPAFDNVFQRGAGTGMGAGIVMAREAGAAVIGKGRFYGHVLSRDAKTNAKIWPYPQLDILCSTGIVVDRDGRRAMDEGRGGIAIANVLARSADPSAYTAIFDSETWDGIGSRVRMAPNPTLLTGGGTLQRATSIEELAVKASLPANDLKKTVAEFNEAVRTGDLSTLAPPRTPAVGRHASFPSPIARPPFFAAPLCVGITYTMDGIKIDAEARVLREDGTAIEGLLAAGANTGGLEGGGSNGGYVGGLLKAGVLGLVAGETAARSNRSL